MSALTFFTFRHIKIFRGFSQKLIFGRKKEALGSLLFRGLDLILEMFSSEQLLYIAGTIILGLVLYYMFDFVWRLERKNDLKFFLLGDVIFMIFFFLLIFSPIDQVASLISSLVIAELTLALVWVELSKRPELKLLDFIPIIHDIHTTRIYRADQLGKLSEPSRFFKIREASYPKYEDLKFEKQFSFTVDLSNIGYTEIKVHEYVVYLDGESQSSIPLWSNPNVERLSLITQQRHTIDIFSFYVKNSGFHKIKVEALATTVKCSKEVWFFISEDFKTLRYIEMAPFKRLLSPLIKAQLDP